MASSSSSPLSRGWYCIIETLADSKQGDLRLLKELINRVPDFYTAAPEPVRERVALRCLEECASRGIVDTKDRSGGTIDISQSSAEVLCQSLTKPIDPSKPLQSTIVPIGNDIRQFIAQKRSTLPKPCLDLFEESTLEGDNTKLPSAKEDGPTSNHRLEDNIVEEEQEVILSPRSADCVESLHKDPSQTLPCQEALDADKTASEPLRQNDPVTVIDNGSNSEATRTEPSGDDINRFILKRRAPVSETSPQPPKESIPETSAPIKTSRNERDGNLRSNGRTSDDQIVSESYPMDSQMPFSEQNQCIICNKGGHLLTCSRKGCGIAVHEGCITTTPSSFDKEGRFYCPCCACTRAANAYARAKKVFSLAKKSLSSFLKMEKNQNKQKDEKGKRPAEENKNDKRNGKKVKCSDGDSSEDGDGDANLAGSFGDASLSCKSASRDSRIRAELNGKRKDKQVKSNDGSVLDDRDMRRRRDEAAKSRKAHPVFGQLEKFVYVKSGPGGTSGKHEAAPRVEERENERREDTGEANMNKKKRHRPSPRYTNKVVAPHRRNMLPWSAEEEEALRQGMHKFGVTADGRIPWSTILEYGRSVFHRTRLPNDLKDKWRNMMKKEG